MGYYSGIDYAEFSITKKGIALATLDDIDVVALIDDEYYKPFFDEDGNIVEIGDKEGHCKHYGEMDNLWHIIAPYVEDGSWIIIEGEERDYWKIVFHNGKAHKYMGHITFEDEK